MGPYFGKKDEFELLAEKEQNIDFAQTYCKSKLFYRPTSCSSFIHQWLLFYFLPFSSFVISFMKLTLLSPSVQKNALKSEIDLFSFYGQLKAFFEDSLFESS